MRPRSPCGVVISGESRSEDEGSASRCKTSLPSNGCHRLDRPEPIDPDAVVVVVDGAFQLMEQTGDLVGVEYEFEYGVLDSDSVSFRDLGDPSEPPLASAVVRVNVVSEEEIHQSGAVT